MVIYEKTRFILFYNNYFKKFKIKSLPICSDFFIKKRDILLVMKVMEITYSK